MKWSWKTELPHGLLILAMLALAAARWSALPDRLPTHFDLAGHADGWGGKFAGLLAIPLVGIGLYLLLLWVPRLDPGRANYAAFQGAYQVIRLLLTALIATVYGWMHVIYATGVTELGRGLPVLLGAMFVVLGNQMGKLRPNWFVGVRTPWTLSSKQSWVKTHRLAGWLFVIAGVFEWILAAFGRPNSLILGLAALIAGMLAAVVYSYVVWRDDPDKTAPAGTLPAE